MTDLMNAKIISWGLSLFEISTQLDIDKVAFFYKKVDKQFVKTGDLIWLVRKNEAHVLKISNVAGVLRPKFYSLKKIDPGPLMYMFHFASDRVVCFDGKNYITTSMVL